MSTPRYVRGTRKNFGYKSRLVRKVFGFMLLIILAATLSVAAFLLYKFGPMIHKSFVESSAIAMLSKEEDFCSEEVGYIYDADGNEILELKQGKALLYVKYNDLPKKVIEAFIAIEDKRYYEHSGVDWMSTAKAIYLLFRDDEITRGGSTITQQLARNIYLSFETSYERKAREIALALELEKKYSKEQILEFYINNINYGNGIYGIGAAAERYFSKTVSDLSVGEIAFLCAIPNNPTYYNPLTNFDNTIIRRDVILQEMYNQGYLSQREYLRAVNSSVTLVEQEVEHLDYVASYALDCAVDAIMKSAGFSFRYTFDNMQDYHEYLERYNTAYAEAKQELYTGGYRVYTSLDTNLQKELQVILDDNLAGFTEVLEDGQYRMQGAATIMDNNSGKVIAAIGGRSSQNTTLGFNRAFQSYKQPGSTIKPLVVYTPQLERGYTADSRVDDSPIEDGPQNSNGYAGETTLRYAVEQSKNVVAWRLFDELKPRVGLGYVQRMHFAKIVPDDYYLSAALGGLTYGVTTEEMAGAYAALLKEGVWTQPTCIISIMHADGTEMRLTTEYVQAFKTKAAKNMTDILVGVGERGTAQRIDLGEHQFAGKTGTTNGQKAGWFCGFTNYYTIAVCVSPDDNSPVYDLYGSTYPASIWQDMQTFLLNGKEPIDFVEFKSTPDTELKEDIEEMLDQEVIEAPEAIEEQVVESQESEDLQETTQQEEEQEEEQDMTSDVEPEPEEEQNVTSDVEPEPEVEEEMVIKEETRIE